MAIIRVDKTDNYDIFIGRPSKFSNPFIINRDGTRSEVLLKFEEYFKNHPDINDLLKELNNKRIACWCNLAQECHGDIIIKIYNFKSFDNVFEY